MIPRLFNMQSRCSGEEDGCEAPGNSELPGSLTMNIATNVLSFIRASLTFCLNPFQRGPVACQIGMLDRLVERDDDLKFSLGSLQGAQRFMNHGQGCST